jgi:lipoprotein-releasing system permease protein
MKFSQILKFAWRYFRAKKSTQAINVISWISVTAIAIGTASLVTIFNAFNGFEFLVKSLYASFYPDLRVSASSGKTFLLDSATIKRVHALKGIQELSCVAEEKALIQHDGLQTIVQLKGVDARYGNVSGVKSHIIRGKYETGNPDQPGLVLGSGIEQALGLVSDRSVYPVVVYLPKKGNTQLLTPDALSVSMAYPQGSFSIQSEFDNKYVLTDLQFLKQYLQYNSNEYGALEIKTNPQSDIDDIRSSIKKILGPEFVVENRFEQNKTLYSTIRLEKLAIYGIFTLILLVAAFNMVGALSMLVLEKSKDIQILKSMGADDRLIKKIFLVEGSLLSGIGTLLGVALAMLIYYVQITYKLVPLSGATFVIDYYPLKLNAYDFAVVGLTVMLIGMAASWFPSAKAARQQPNLRS